MYNYQQLKPITVLGAGSWGTALALSLARRGQTVRIWSHVQSEIDAMLAEKTNNRFLPGFTLPASIQPIANLKQAIDEVDDIIIVVPSVGFRQTLIQLKKVIHKTSRIICATKGLDIETGQLLGEVTEQILGKEHAFAVLSGPSFAREVAAGLPCAVVIASDDDKLLHDLKERFHNSLFHVDVSHDVIGVEFGGVAKNVVAIATGISDGLELGSNARSALITRGLAELIELGKAIGAQRETLIGLSGLGDLILTCSDNQSRNRRLGLAIGKGQNIEQAEREIGQVIEGKRNAELLIKLAREHSITVPICETVWDILRGHLSGERIKEHLFNVSVVDLSH